MSKLTIYGPFFQDCFIRVEPGCVESNMKSHDDEESAEWNAAIDGVESLLLAMASSGVSMNTPEMRQAVEVAIEAIANHHS